MKITLTSHRADEHWFWHQVRTLVGLPGRAQRSRFSPRELISAPRFPLHYKRAWYLLEKWSGKTIYDYGVTVDLGWVTPLGMSTYPDSHRVGEFIKAMTDNAEREVQQ